MRSSIISAIVASGLLVSATAVGARQSGPVPTRDGAEVENSDELGGLLMIIGLIVVLLIIVLAIMASRGGRSDSSTTVVR